MLAKRVQFFLVSSILAFALPAWSQGFVPDATDSVRGDHHKIMNNLRTTFAPYTETSVVTQGGRTDSVLLTSTSWTAVRDMFQQAHRRSTVLSSGGKIAGWYVNKTKRLATYTMHLNGHSYTIAAQPLNAGTRITVLGDVRNHAESRRIPGKTVRRNAPLPGLYRL